MIDETGRKLSKRLRNYPEPELVFERFDNQYFLARVVPGDDSEREIPLTPARMEHEIVRLALEP
jgi:isoleucyl-tRNA synthetase